MRTNLLLATEGVAKASFDLGFVKWVYQELFYNTEVFNRWSHDSCDFGIEQRMRPIQQCLQAPGYLVKPKHRAYYTLGSPTGREVHNIDLATNRKLLAHLGSNMPRSGEDAKFALGSTSSTGPSMLLLTNAFIHKNASCSVISIIQCCDDQIKQSQTLPFPKL